MPYRPFPARANSWRAAGVAAAVLLPTLSSLGFAKVTWKEVASFEYRWQPDHAVVRFTLETPNPWDGAGDFTKIRIQVPGRQTFTLSKGDGWVRFSSDSAALRAAVRKSNLVDTEYVLLMPAQGRDRVLAFLFGWAYASSPGSLDVIELISGGSPRLILHRDELGLEALKDLNGDGTAEIVGYPCLSQEWGNGFLTYDPYHVYQLSSTRGNEAALSLALSKMYNLKYYYGWAGPNCREDLAVVRHPPGGGKARIMKKDDAEQLTCGGQEQHQK